MAEPDLVFIGDRVAVDMASIVVVCHLNTRGNFELVPIRRLDAQSDNSIFFELDRESNRVLIWMQVPCFLKRVWH